MHLLKIFVTSNPDLEQFVMSFITGAKTEIRLLRDTFVHFSIKTAKATTRITVISIAAASINMVITLNFR